MTSSRRGRAGRPCFLLTSVALLCAGWLLVGSATAAEIVGRIDHVDEQSVRITITGEFDPRPGDAFTVSVEIPGVGIARVGAGEVQSLDGGRVIGRVTASSGKIEIGQKVTIESPQASKREVVPAAATPPPAQAPTGEAKSDVVLNWGATFRDVDAATAELLDLPDARGCVVTAVSAGSPAGEAGLKKRDVVRALGGKAVADRTALAVAVVAASAEGVLKLDVWRDGSSIAIDVVLPAPVSPPASGGVAAPTGAANTPVYIGAQLQNYRDDVRIVSVFPGTPADRAGLRYGDVLMTLDGEPVKEMFEFIQAVSAAQLGQSRKLVVQRNGQSVAIEVRPEPRLSEKQLLAQFQKLAEAGNHEAQYRLGVAYQSGSGLDEPDLVEAMKWYRQAAEAGHAAAQSEYGINLFQGRGAAADREEGVTWIRKAAEQGDSAAVRNMGWLCKAGLVVEKNLDEARRWYERALADGSLQAIVDCARLYEAGEVFAKDVEKAAELFHIAAKRGNAVAQFNWSRCLYNGVGTPVDVRTAVMWAKKSVDGGSSSGMVFLASMYSLGRGVTQSHEEAVKLYRQAAALDDPDGQYWLGSAYYEGKGVAQDHAEAARWFKASAEGGRDDARVQIGFMYTKGQGVPQNDEQAVAWYRKGAEAGHTVSQYNLGLMYREGRGVDQDYDEAMK